MSDTPLTDYLDERPWTWLVIAAGAAFAGVCAFNAWSDWSGMAIRRYAIAREVNRACLVLDGL